MIVEKINEQVTTIGNALNELTFQTQNLIRIIYKIASEDYQKEVVETNMVDIEELSKKEWIQDRYDYYMSKEFLE